MSSPQHPPPVAAATSLNSKGYGINKEALSVKELEDLRRELTVSPVLACNGLGFQVQPPRFPVFRESSKKIYVPKFYGLSRFGLPRCDELPRGQDVQLPFAGTMRPEQMGPVEEFMGAARDPSRRGGILNIPCGGGKTVIALRIISELGKKTLIVVHKDFLLEQWRERIGQFLPTATVGTIKGKVLDVQGKDIVIASLQSLSMKEYDTQCFADFGLLIVDEVHRTATEVFSQAFHKINFGYSLGLSATVKRKDGLTKVFIWFIGDIVHRRKRDREQVEVRVEHFHSHDLSYSDIVPVRGATQGLNLSKMLNNICAYPPRTQLIAQRIAEMLRGSQQRKVLVLSDRKQQLRDLHARLAEAGIEAGFYIGGMKPEDLRASEACSVILATFSFASEGFDVPGLDTLVLASPKTDIEQAVGRILRLKPEMRKNVPVVLDVVDGFSVYPSQFKKRRAYYRRNGYLVVGDAGDGGGEGGGGDDSSSSTVEQGAWGQVVVSGVTARRPAS